MNEANRDSLPISKNFGVLTIKELKELDLFSIENGTSLYPECYSNASFDFTLGDEFFFPKQYQEELESIAKTKKLPSISNLSDEDKQRALKNQIRYCSNNSRILKLPKFSSVVISTNELVNLPNNVAGRFDLRVRWAMAGLVLQVGAQIEPGYKGRLWGLLHNFSGQEVIIIYNDKNDRLLTGEFYFTCEDSPPTPEKLKKPVTLEDLLKKYPVKSGSLQNYFDEFESLYNKIEEKVNSELEVLNDSRTKFENHTQKQIDDELKRIDGLRTEINTTQTNVRAVSDRVHDRRATSISWLFLIGTFLISIILPIAINKFTFDRDDYLLFDHSKELKSKFDNLNSRFDSLSSENNKLHSTVVAKQTKIDSLQIKTKKR